MRITQFVPVAAFAGARMFFQLRAHRFDGGFELRIANALLVAMKEDFPRRDHVDVVVLHLVRGDGTIGLNERLDCFRAVLGVRGVAGAIGEFEEG